MQRHWWVQKWERAEQKEVEEAEKRLQVVSISDGASISTISTQSKQLAAFVRQSCHTHPGDTYPNSIHMPLSLAVSVQRRTRHAIQDVAPLEKNLLHQSRTAVQKSLGDLSDAPTTDLALELLCPHLRPWLV